MAASLNGLRSEVGELSLRILDLLSERASLVGDIGALKRQCGMPVRDAQREAELLAALKAHNRGPLDDRSIERLFRHIIDACVDAMDGTAHRGLRVEAGSGPPVRIEVGRARLGPGTVSYLAGPCAIESEAQLDDAAGRLAALGVRMLRAGAFKPRTSPHAFQGLGEEGLRILERVGRRHGLATITEATGPQSVEPVARHADIIQIGARNMYNYELLRAAGRTGKPVLLKRSFSATLDEWLHAAEYVALSGSERIVLCERGIRTFARETRNTLDLSVVPLALARSRLPVVVDVSHAAGRRDILAPLTAAAFAAGAHGVMLEVHPDPDAALSDAEQQLSIEQFALLRQQVATSFAWQAELHEPAAESGPRRACPPDGPSYQREGNQDATQRCV